MQRYPTGAKPGRKPTDWRPDGHLWIPRRNGWWSCRYCQQRAQTAGPEPILGKHGLCSGRHRLLASGVPQKMGHRPLELHPIGDDVILLCDGAGLSTVVVDRWRRRRAPH